MREEEHFGATLKGGLSEEVREELQNEKVSAVLDRWQGNIPRRGNKKDKHLKAERALRYLENRKQSHEAAV